MAEDEPQVLPVKQFHVGPVTYHCEDSRRTSALIIVLFIAAERTYRAKSNPSARAVAATAGVSPSEFASQRRTISRPKTKGSRR